MERPSSGARYFFAGVTGAIAAVLSFTLAGSPPTRDGFESLRSTATLIVAACGVWVANQGLRTWQRTLQGTAQFDVSKEFLAGVFRLRAALAIYRHPLGNGAVITAATEDLGIAPSSDTPIKDRRYQMPSDDRWTKVVEAMNECERQAVNAEVILGPQIQALVGRLWGVVREVHEVRRVAWAVQMREEWEKRDLAMGIAMPDRLEAVHSKTPIHDRYSEVLHDTGTDGEFNRRLHKCFADAEALVAEHIRSHMVRRHQYDESRG